MFSFLARRMLTVFLPTLLGLSMLVFGAMHLIPGSFVDILLGVGQDISEEQKQRVVAQYGLDQPVPVQYVRWLGNVFTGDFGTSLKSGKPVASEILSRLPVTLELAFLATVASLILAIPAGIVAAIYRGRWPDTVLRLVALLGLSVPNFLIATLLVLFVSTQWSVLPTTGFVPVSEGLWANLKSLAMPTVSLGALLAASMMRMMRSSMLEEFGKEYLTVARAKGLQQRTVIMSHALRNSLIPVITVLGIQTGYMLGGTVIIEQVFAIPGIGRLALDAVNQRDYPLVQGTVLFIASAFVFMNLLTDVIYGLVDPRIRVGGKAQ